MIPGASAHNVNVGGAAIFLSHEGSPYISAYSFAQSIGTEFSNPASVVGGTVNQPRDITISPSQGHVAFAHDSTGKVAVYGWSSAGFGAKVADPATAMTSDGESVAFHPSGSAILIGTQENPFMSSYVWTGSFGGRASDPATKPGGKTNAVSYSPDGAYIVVGHDDTPWVGAWPYTLSTNTIGTKMSNPATLIGNGAPITGMAWSLQGDYVLFSAEITPYIHAYAWSGGFGTKASNPATGVGAVSYNVTFSKDGSYVAVAGDEVGVGVRNTTVYGWTGSGFGTKLSDPAGGASGNATGVAFFSKDTHIAMSVDDLTATNRLQMWQWSNGFGTKLSAPATGPEGTSWGIAIKNISKV